MVSKAKQGGKKTKENTIPIKAGMCALFYVSKFCFMYVLPVSNKNLLVLLAENRWEQSIHPFELFNHHRTLFSVNKTKTNPDSKSQSLPSDVGVHLT